MKVSTRTMVGVIAATALIAPLALATSAQAAPRGGKGEARSAGIEAPRAARQAEAAQPRAGRSEARQSESRRESTRPQRAEVESGHQCDDDAAPVVQLPA
ncbi:MAG: hypothetical protein ACKOAF_01115 [Actinomycetes bacterium]